MIKGLLCTTDQGAKEILGRALCEDGDEILKSFEQPGIFIGPHTGFLNDGPALLVSIIERRKLKEETKIRSSELELTVINNSNINKWSREAVLCHNDPTPRKILRPGRDQGTSRHIELELPPVPARGSLLVSGSDHVPARTY
jgi:hypothetical protein